MHEATIPVTNETSATFTLVLEPWGAEVPLPPGSFYVVRALSNTRGQLEVEQQGEVVTVCAWPGCTVEVLDGARVVEAFPIPVPDVPAGMSVPDFMSLMFGR
jgi:hypothetical protein